MLSALGSTFAPDFVLSIKNVGIFIGPLVLLTIGICIAIAIVGFILSWAKHQMNQTVHQGTEYDEAVFEDYARNMNGPEVAKRYHDLFD